MKKIYVIGGGVSGLSVGVKVAEHYRNQNVEVIIVAEKMTPNTTSDLVAGLWGPYLMGETPTDKIVQWSKISHEFFHELWLEGLADEAGIVMIPCYRFDTENSKVNHCWKDIVFGFREVQGEELSRLAREHGRKYLYGCHFVTFCCEPIKFLPYLMKRFQAAGGKFKQQKVKSFDEFKDAALIINCTGLGGKELGDEKLHPIRGQISKVKAPWLYYVYIDDSDDGNYIIPNADSVTLGGTHQVNNYSTKVSTADNDFITQGCRNVDPSLDDAVKIRDVAGLRPGRSQVKLETEHRGGGKTTIIHNIGHGGCGVTLCWGCADEVLQRTVDVLSSISKL